MSISRTGIVGSGEGGAGDERKLVTVMFADISGFTTLSSRMDPEDVSSLMNACFDALVPAVDRYGGTIDKFIGDEIMAIFGAPVAYEDHAERALRAALLVQASLHRFNEERGLSLGMHVGVNTGTVLAGGVGSTGRRQYSVMGDAVNLAARLREAAAEGTILVGPATFRLASPSFEFEAAEALFIKGRTEPLAVYALKGEASGAHTRGRAGLSSPLVGRENELLTLREAVEGLAAGRGLAISVVGDPGLGKSRLIFELRRTVSGRVSWGEGRALSHTERTNYGIARDLLADLLGANGEPPPGVELPRESRPYLRRLAGFSPDPGDEASLDALLPEALQRRMHHAFADFVTAMCARGPVVLAWEDLHWADPSSLGLLEGLLPLSDRQPLLVLLAYRAGEARLSEWLARVRSGRGAAHRIVALEPLGHDASGRLIDNLLPVESIPAETREAILAKAEGNPFFVEELLRSLVDAGATERSDVPDTLKGVIAARVDRLAAPEKRTLQTASVIGRLFTRPLLAGLLAEDGAAIALDPALAELERRELVRRRTNAEMIFKHALTQEVAYGGILKSRRRALHEMVAEVTASLYPGRLDERAAELGFHYERAERHDKAATHLTKAADRARATFSNAEAIAFYRAAVSQLRLATDDELPADDRRARAAQLQENLADVCAQIGRQDEARCCLREAGALLEADDRLGRSRLCRKEGMSWVADRLPEAASEAFDRADAALADSPDALDALDAASRHEWIELAIARGWGDYWLGRLRELDAGTARLRPVVERYGTASQRTMFFRNTGLAEFRRDRYVTSDASMANAQRAMAAAVESGNPVVMVHATFLLGFCYFWRRELEPARTVLERSLGFAERIGHAEGVVLGLSYLAIVDRYRGDLAAVRTGVERSFKAAAEAKMTAYVALARAGEAWLAWRRGDPLATAALGRSALEGWGQLAFPARAYALWPLAAVALTQDRLEEAVGHVRAMLAPDQMRLPAELATAMEACLAAWESGASEIASSNLHAAAAVATSLGFL